MRFTLTAAENQSMGDWGWLDSRIPRGSDLFEPLSYAPGLAHDCLEHFAFGNVADEIEAHGAMYWTRYEGGWSDPKYAHTLDTQSFASEWINLYNGLQANSYLPVPPRTKSLDSDIEAFISEVIVNGSRTIRNEFDADTSEHDIERLSEVFRAYFRRGYRKAVRRFKGMNACEVGNLYNVLAKRLEAFPIEPGMVLSVHIDKRGNVEIKEKALDYA